MKARYSKYFLNRVLWLKDELHTYYVQNRFMRHNEIFGVELKSFFEHRQAVQWLKKCMAHDHMTGRKLRKFLSQHAGRAHILHRMDDFEVIDEVAGLIMRHNYPVVICPLFEKPWRNTNTIDVICAILNDASLSQINQSPVLAKARQTLKQSRVEPDDDEQTGDKNQIAVHSPNHNEITPKIRRAAADTILLVHGQNGWDRNDAFDKIIFNAVKLLSVADPGLLQLYSLDTLISTAVDDFTQQHKTPWPEPEQTELLLASHIQTWIEEKEYRRPSAKEKEPEETATPAIPPRKEREKDWIGVELLDEQGNPVSGHQVTIKTGDGRLHNLITNQDGRAMITDIDPDNPDIDWQEIDELDFLS
jgi:hypothetical protein